MSVRAYLEYKNSEVTWLGAVPSHWRVGRIKDLFEIRKRISGELGHDILSITQAGIKVKDIDSNDGQLSMDYSKYQLVRPGDFAMNHMDLLTGWIDISSQQGVTSPDYRVFALRAPASDISRFFLYVFQMAYSRRQFFPFGQGSSQLGRWRLPTDAFYGFPLPVPSKHEQSAIAAFLDRETAKIDVLVAEQGRLIALLKEKRQAVISHAVTKGLNANAAMKDSGIEWLGEIPAHWELKRLKNVAVEPLKYGANEAADGAIAGDPRFVRITDIAEDGSLRDATFRSLPYEVAAPYLLDENDILLARSGGTVGKSFIYRKSWGMCCFAGYLIRLRLCSESYSPDFVYQLLNSNAYWQQLGMNQIQSTIQNFSAEKYAGMVFGFPPINEQTEIVDKLSKRLSQYSLLISEAQSAITLLHERRAALISAAVTGKIDVRGLIEQQEMEAA